jgi:pimeloyl-ACP methyl ester carboxylesterase
MIYKSTPNKRYDTQHRLVNSISQGEGPPVILIHGMAASLCDWSSLAPELAANGYNALALDLLGHGGSAKPDDPREYHTECLYQNLITWIKDLELHDPVVLVGHSLGGYLSLLTALRTPEMVRGLVLINPFYEAGQLSRMVQWMSQRPSLAEKAMRITPQWMVHAVLGWNPDLAAHFSPQIRQQIAVDYKRASPHFIYITRELQDLTSDLDQIQIPTCVIWGERDLTLKPSSFSQLVQRLPNASGYPVSATGHQPHITQPDRVNRTVLNFLEGLL